jgi:O-methyltransferase
MSPHPDVALFPEWNPPLPRKARLANRLLAQWGIPLRLERVINGCFDMSTVEQRFCLAQLLHDVVQDDVAGDVAEFGCFEGKTAALLTRVLEGLGSSRRVHLYDSFETIYFLGEGADVEAKLRANFQSVSARLPETHKGRFEQTIPHQLPEKICFAHLDCGTGGDQALHRRSLLHCLTHLYPRLAPGGVCVLMDYNDGTFPEIPDGLPAVRLAVDEFLRDKPEKPILLWGGQGAMAYFRRQRSRAPETA